ncbi:MAG: GGDEF domain-containing protein [Pseudomonadales bacterium]
MNRRLTVPQQILLITMTCIAGSVVITLAVNYALTGSPGFGTGMFIAVLAPAIMVPIGSYFHVSMTHRLREANEQLRRLSETDPLTQTYNRRRFIEVAETQLALARRHCFPTSVLLIDFDRFKDINDAYGHLAGDRVLVEASALIREMLRDSDSLARFGGEEFICLLPHTAREGAQMVAERIIASMREHAFAHDGKDIHVTVSIGGVTCETSDTSLERMTSKADSLMYEAKQAGRDRYIIENLPRQGSLPLREAGVAQG